jgi:hypothetical protein
MSSSFTNQVLAQLDLHFSTTGQPTLSGTKYDANRVYIRPRSWMKKWRDSISTRA